LDYKAMIRLGTKVPKSLPNRTVGGKTLTFGELCQNPGDTASVPGGERCWLDALDST